MLKPVGLFFIIVLLSACSLSPVKTASKSTYILNAVPPKSHALHAKPQVLLVSMPQLDAVMNNNNMVYLDGQYQVGYFSEHRWAAKPSSMFFSVLLETLQQQSGFRAVVGAPYSGQNDLRLDITHLSIVQDFTVKPSRVVVTMQARLMDTKQQSVLKTRSIEASVVTSAETPQAGVIAANQAVARCLTQIVDFVN